MGVISHLNLPSLVCHFLFWILLLIKYSKERYWKNNVFFRYLLFCPHFPITLVGRGVRKIDQYSLSKCSMLGVSEEIGTISLSRKYFFFDSIGWVGWSWSWGWAWQKGLPIDTWQLRKLTISITHLYVNLRIWELVKAWKMLRKKTENFIRPNYHESFPEWNPWNC